MNKFSPKIKEYRQKKRLSIRKCAELLEVSPTYLVRLEDGTTPPPSDKVIQKLSEVLEIDLNELNDLANEYLEYLGKAKPENIRVPHSEKVPGFLRSVSKHVKNPEDWDAIAKMIEEQRGKSDK